MNVPNITARDVSRSYRSCCLSLDLNFRRTKPRNIFGLYCRHFQEIQPLGQRKNPSKHIADFIPDCFGDRLQQAVECWGKPT